MIYGLGSAALLLFQWRIVPCTGVVDMDNSVAVSVDGPEIQVVWSLQDIRSML